MSFTGNKLLTASNASTRPLNWQTSSGLVFGSKYSSVTYGNGRFVAVYDWTSGLGNDLIYSDDGVTWQLSGSGTGSGGGQGNWVEVTYGNGLFVAVTDGQAIKSTDGNIWTAASDTSIPNYTSALTYGEGLFLAVSSFNSNLGYSTNGVSWTSGASISTGLGCVTYGLGRFVGLSYDAGSGIAKNGTPTNIGGHSETGTGGWVNFTVPTSQNWTNITFGNNRFVAFPYPSNTANPIPTIYSNDGITWELGGNLPGSAQGGIWTGLTYGNGRFVAVKSTNQVNTDFNYAYSIDGINWTTGIIALKNSYTSVAHGNGRFVAVSSTTDVNKTNLIAYTT